MISLFRVIFWSTLLQPSRLKRVPIFVFFLIGALQSILLTLEESVHDRGHVILFGAISLGSMILAAGISSFRLFSNPVRSNFLDAPRMIFAGSTGILLVNLVARELGFELNLHVFTFLHAAGCFLVSFFAADQQPDFAVSAYGDEHELEAIRRMRDLRLEELGPTIGLMSDYPIPGWIRLSDGTKLPFKGMFSGRGPDEIPAGHVVLPPGLIYGRDGSESE